MPSFFRRLTDFFKRREKTLSPEFFLPERLKYPKTSKEYFSTIDFASEMAEKHGQVVKGLDEIVSKIINERLRVAKTFNQQEKTSMNKLLDEMRYEMQSEISFLNDLNYLKNSLVVKKEVAEISEEAYNTLKKHLDNAIKKIEEQYKIKKPFATEMSYPPSYTVDKNRDIGFSIKYTTYINQKNRKLSLLIDLERELQQHLKAHAKTKEEYLSIKKAYEQEQEKIKRQEHAKFKRKQEK